MTWVGEIKPEDVVDAQSFAAYAQQKLGVPYPTGKDIAILRRQVKQLFEQQPTATWMTLVRTVQWAVEKKKRYARVYTLVGAFRYAYADGYLPELDPKEAVDEDVERGIAEALQIERDATWRRRLIGAQGEMRATVLNAWRESSPSSPTTSRNLSGATTASTPSQEATAPTAPSSKKK